MKISYNWLQSFFNKKLPVPEKLADLLTFHSFEVEEVKENNDDWILDIDVLPNRSHDCLSHKGIAREISVLLKYPFKLIDYGKKIKESKELASKVVKIEVEDKKMCSRYTSRVVVDVKIDSSPKWIQDRLITCGLKPISNVVDIANYVMLETGQPMHAFDADKIAGNKIVVRKAKKGEKMVSLDNEKYDLDENVLVIADEKGPVCIAGIKGGINPGIDGQTKRIVLEAANFNLRVIRQGSKKINLRTDASWRFENGLDPNLTQEAIDMCTYLIQKIAKGKVLKGLIDIYQDEREAKKINLDTFKVRSLLGINISDKDIIDILKRLNFKVKKTKNKLQVTVPTIRLDLSIPEDLIEEIGRIYGFEKIPSQLPNAFLIPSKKREDLIYQNKIKDILTNLGFSEVYNYSLLSNKESIKLANPVSQEQKYLRSSLMTLLIKNIKDNKRYFERVRLFEIGKVFYLDKRQVIEKKKLACIISLDEKKKESQEFYHLKGVIDSLLNKIGISDIWYDDTLGKNRKAEIKVGNDLLGYIEEIESNIAGFEIDFEKIVQLATEERVYAAPSKYPAMVRDISVLVDHGTKVVEVLNLINRVGGFLVRDIDLFDIYKGENIPDSKKNLAFHIVFQSDERTLVDSEVNQLRDIIITALEKEGGWEVRKQNA